MNTVDRILFLISEKGITKSKLLRDIEINKNSFVNWQERGNTPSGDVLVLIADYFGVSTDYLLGREEAQKEPPAAGSGSEGPKNELEEQLMNHVQKLTQDQKEFLLAQIKTMQERK